MATTIKGYKIKDGKVIKTPPRKSVSQKIADRKRPQQKYVRASSQEPSSWKP